MSDGASKGWMVTAIALGIVAVGAGGFAYQQHDKLTAQLAAATDDAKQAHVEAASLKSQLEAANQQLTSYGQQVRADQQQLVKAEQQIGTDQQRIAYESRPDLPIKLSFKRALISQGEVAFMQNTSNRTLQFMLDVHSETGQNFHRQMTVNPGQTYQFGAHEGWAFASGQIVTLSNPGYKPIMVRVSG